MPSPNSKSSRAPAAVESTIPPQWEWHYRTLVALGEKAVRESTEHRQEVVADAGSPGLREIASDTSENDVLFAELQNEEHLLTEISAALQRIRAGTYGVCSETGRSIEPERLRAIPWTHYCQAAAERRERK